MVLNLNARESHWINYIQNNVVPKLLGSSSERAKTAAIVSWWALKEGVFDLPNPWRHSLCHTSAGDRQIGDLEVCQNPTWQVGLSGIQVNATNLSHVENIARQIYKTDNIPSILRKISNDANVPENIKTSIENSTGQLRKSWLLRDPAISFTIQKQFVQTGCIDKSFSWCFGNWETARKFASSKERIQNVIGSLSSQFERSEPISIFAGLVLVGSIAAIGYIVAKQQKWIR